MDEIHDESVERRKDELLVIRCQLGERAAFDHLIDRWHDSLWRCARRLTGDDAAADDIAQEVWLRVLRGIGRLRDGASLRAWLFGIARRVWADRLRAQYAAPATSDVDPADLPGVETDDRLEAELAALRDELLRLPVVEREVLTLFYLQELSLQEVAAVLRVPIGTVKSRLFRARRLLQREMETGGMR